MPFLTSYHGKNPGKTRTPRHDSYPDYWRFTHEGLYRLFEDFEKVEVYPLGGPIEFRLQSLYLANFLANPLIRRVLDRIDRPSLGKATIRHLLYGVK